MMLSGRIALVTGGAKGLGRAIATRLVNEGARVAIFGRDEKALGEAAASMGVVPFAVDVTDAESVRRALSRIQHELGPIQVLVQNAGIAESAPLARTDDAMWNRIFDVNVHAPFRIARELIPAMVESGWGRVIHIASNAGLTGYAYTAAYVASKHALVGLTRALAAEFAATPVTINAVCPGFLDTPMTDRTVSRIVEKTGRSAIDAKKTLEAMNPQKRLVQVEEVAHIVAMLVSPHSSAVNGCAIPIDGGQVMA